MADNLASADWRASVAQRAREAVGASWAALAALRERQERAVREARQRHYEEEHRRHQDVRTRPHVSRGNQRGSA